KYFYDKKGSEIFCRIMDMPEYYLTSSDYDIFRNQSTTICDGLQVEDRPFDLIELGPGDGMKSRLLLRVLYDRGVNFTYIPVDISGSALKELDRSLQQEMQGLSIEGRQGDFFPAMEGFGKYHHHPRVILFLGSNIGNFSLEERHLFLVLLARMTAAGDKVIMGFDLKKSPRIILDAYDDPHGITRDFNLNHLERINRELQADFDPATFQHHVSYDPFSGATKSFLVSKISQSIHLGATGDTITFRQWEPIFMELSAKFSHDDIGTLAGKYGFTVKQNFNDGKNYFTDSLWVRNEIKI
ncbi:MAG: L-histidine N(alpha)-methyltransferase, partial [Bacteroidota bacterium]